MPRTIKDFLPKKDYAGRLFLGLVLLLISQAMTLYSGTVYLILRWVFFTAAIVNYGMIMYFYQIQKEDKIRAREEAQLKPSETDQPKD